MKYYWLYLLFVAFPAFSQPGSGLNTDSILQVLEQEIAAKSTYEQAKLKKLSVYKEEFLRAKTLTEKYRTCWHIVDEYKSFHYDSAFHYSTLLTNLANEIGSEELSSVARMKMAFVLESGGLFKEAADTLSAISISTHTPDSIKSEFHFVAARLYDFLTYYVQDYYYNKIYLEKCQYHIDEELKILSTNSLRYYFIQIKHCQIRRDYQRTAKLYNEMVRHFQPGYHDMAMRSYDLGQSYSDHSPEAAVYYKALSAIYDIKGAIKENIAIREVAEALFEQGDIRRASMFIKQALDDAKFYSSRLRKVEVSDILPIIEGKQYQELETRNDRVTTYSYIITSLVIILALSLFVIFRQLQKLRHSQRSLDIANESLFNTNLKLEESNKIKEAYIGQFFNTISEYLFKTEKLVNSINRKLSQRRFDDLSEIADGVNLFKEREHLYNDFDEMFLKLFPEFIENLNELLNEGEKLNPSLRILTPEVRIIALMRLGITDNNKIARLLNYSINTIYTYKTRIKNKAMEPDVFEDRVTII